MKKILLYSLLLPLVSLAQLPEDFASGIPATWAVFAGTNGEGTTEEWTASTNGYVYCGFEAVTTLSEDWLVTPSVSVTSAATILSFDAADYYTNDYGSNYYVKVSTSSQTDISTFTTVASYTEADMSHGSLAQMSVDLASYAGQSVYIAFVLEQNDGDVFFLDNVELLASQNPPGIVTTPTPADGATNVTVDENDNNSDGTPDDSVLLSWVAATSGDPATSYKIYWGTDASSLNLLGATSNTSVTILGLDGNTTYYWSIVASNVGGDATGSSVWSFTTGALLSNESFENTSTATSIYPNPATDLINITLSNKFDVANTIITVFDLTGKKVASFESIENVTVESLQTGVYILEITDGVNKETQKIVKK